MPYLAHKQNGTGRQNNLAFHSCGIKSISANYFQNPGAGGGILRIDFHLKSSWHLKKKSLLEDLLISNLFGIKYDGFGNSNKCN